YYNSTQIPRFGYEIARMGSSWRHSYQRFIDVTEYDSYFTAFAKRPDGKVQFFTARSLQGPYLPGQFVADRLERIDSVGSSIRWQYTNAGGDIIDTYNPAGVLTYLSK